MRLLPVQSYALLERFGCYVKDVCDKCGQILGPVRCTRRGEAGPFTATVAGTGGGNVLSGSPNTFTAANTFNAASTFNGNVTATTISASGQITSTVSTGTAPFVVSSTTQVANLNAGTLGGATFASPGPIGSTTPSTGAFTTTTASTSAAALHFLNLGSSPTCSVTGAGTGATCDTTTVSGTGDASGIMTIHTGTSPSASGTIQLTFSSLYGLNGFCVYMLASTVSSWNARATVISFGPGSGNQQATWDNNAVNLTGSSQYGVLYVCHGK